MKAVLHAFRAADPGLILVENHPDIDWIVSRSHEDIANHVADADILILNNRTCTPELGERLRARVGARLKWIHFSTAGVELGLAMGLSSIDSNDPGSSLKASSIFTGIWGLIVPLIALFVGGMVASRGAGVTTKMNGALHGLVMWGLTTLAGAWLLTNIISTVVGGVASVGKTSVSGTTMRHSLASSLPTPRPHSYLVPRPFCANALP